MKSPISQSPSTANKSTQNSRRMEVTIWVKEYRHLSIRASMLSKECVKMKARIKSLPSFASDIRSRTGYHKITGLGELPTAASSSKKNASYQQSTRQKSKMTSQSKVASMHSFEKELMQRVGRLRQHTNAARESFNQLHTTTATAVMTNKYLERRIRVQCQKAIEAYETGWDRYVEYNTKKMNGMKKQQRALELFLKPITEKYGEFHS